MSTSDPAEAARSPVQQELGAPEGLQFEERQPRLIQPVSLAYVPRELAMHSVTEEELSTLRGVGPTLTVTFLGIATGAALTFWSVLDSSGLNADDRNKYNAMFWAARLLVALFAAMAVYGYVHLFRVINRIKRRPKPEAQ